MMQMFINDNHNMEIAVIFTKIPHDTGIVLGTKGTANINFLTKLSYYIDEFFYQFQRKYIIFHLLSTIHFQMEWGMIVLMNFF